jgi:hypothetical protein
MPVYVELLCRGDQELPSLTRWFKFIAARGCYFGTEVICAVAAAIKVSGGREMWLRSIE